jgi:integrase
MVDFEKWLKDIGGRSSTRNQHLRVLQSFSNWMKTREYILKDYSQNIPFLKEKASTGDIEFDKRKKSKEQTFLTKEEVELFIRSAKSIDKKLRFALMADMGLRREEIINLLREDIKGDKLMIRGKGGTFETLQMTPMVHYLVTEYLKNRKDDCEYLIVSKVGKHQIKNSGDIYDMVKRDAKKLGIDPEKLDIVSPHSFRRSMICNNILSGTNLYTIQTMARHKNITTTEIYAKALKNIAANEEFSKQPMPNMDVLSWQSV